MIKAINKVDQFLLTNEFTKQMKRPVLKGQIPRGNKFKLSKFGFDSLTKESAVVLLGSFATHVLRIITLCQKIIAYRAETMQTLKYKFDIDLWPFDPKINSLPLVMGNTCMKCHHCISKGNGVILWKPLFHRQRGRRTDGNGETSILPHDFVGGCINITTNEVVKGLEVLHRCWAEKQYLWPHMTGLMRNKLHIPILISFFKLQGEDFIHCMEVLISIIKVHSNTSGNECWIDYRNDVLWNDFVRGSTQVLNAFFLVYCGCDTSYIVSFHIQRQAFIYTLSLCRGHSWRVRLAKQETLTPPWHMVSPLVCRGPWMSTVVLYCWRHSDNASVLLTSWHHRHV